MKKLSVLTVSVNSDLPKYLIKSFEKFKPSDLSINYIVVENTKYDTYKNEICSINNNIRWVNNHIQSGEGHHIMDGGSNAHAHGLHSGLNYVKDEWVFVCDHDICITSRTFFEELFQKVEEGFDLIGASYHPQNRVVHPNGLLVKTEIIKQVDLKPDGMWDTASKLTHFVGDNHYVFRNTWNDSSLVELIDEPYKSWGSGCGIDRCLDSNNNVMFVHLGRGTAKFANLYKQAGKKTYGGWVKFVNELLKKDIGEVL